MVPRFWHTADTFGRERSNWGAAMSSELERRANFACTTCRGSVTQPFGATHVVRWDSVVGGAIVKGVVAAALR